MNLNVGKIGKTKGIKAKYQMFINHSTCALDLL
jgi:hypothetical protein